MVALKGELRKRIGKLGRGAYHRRNIARNAEAYSFRKTGWRTQHGAFERKKATPRLPIPKMAHVFATLACICRREEAGGNHCPKVAHVSSPLASALAGCKGKTADHRRQGESHRSISVCCKGGYALLPAKDS